MTEILCRDKAWGWARLGSRQGSPCVETKSSQGWDTPVTTEDFMSRQGFLRAVLRYGVFLSLPTGQARACNRVLGACTTGLGTYMSTRPRSGAVRATEPTARTA